MRRIERNTLMNTIEFLSQVDSKYITFERSWLDNVKRFFKLPYYEMVVIYTDENKNDIKEAYLTKVFPKNGKVFVY